MMRNQGLIFLLLSSLLTGGVAVAQQPQQSVLGANGQVYEIYAGTFGELFPGNSSHDPENAVLALDVLAQSEPPQRHLVPSTGDVAQESEPRLVYDKTSDNVNIVWNATLPNGELRLQLTNYTSSGWNDQVHELYRSGGGQISPPRVSLTRDAYALSAGDGQTLSADRATLHLLWQEQEGTEVAVKYMPVLLVAGSYIGWSETFTLGASSTLEGPDGEPAAVVSNAAPHLAKSSREGTIVVSFTDTGSDSNMVMLKTYQIGILPLELVYLSDEVQQQVLNLASEFADGEVSSFADTMRLHIIGLGSSYGFHPAVVDYVANEVHAHLLDVGDGYTDLELLSNDLRDYAIDLTTSLFGSDLSAPDGDDGSEIIEIDLSDLPIGDEGDQLAQILDLKVASEVPMPSIVGGESSIYTSPAGDELIVAWSETDDDGERLVYVEYTHTTGWSEPASLELGERLDLARAHQLLADRLR